MRLSWKKSFFEDIYLFCIQVEIKLGKLEYLLYQYKQNLLTDVNWESLSFVE